RPRIRQPEEETHHAWQQAAAAEGWQAAATAGRQAGLAASGTAEPLRLARATDGGRRESGVRRLHLRRIISFIACNAMAVRAALPSRHSTARACNARTLFHRRA